MNAHRLNDEHADEVRQIETEAMRDAARAANPIREVYPGYIMHRIKRALTADIPLAEGMIVSVGGMETVGDCRYALAVTDDNGTAYRVTVEVAS